MAGREGAPGASLVEGLGAVQCSRLGQQGFQVVVQHEVFGTAAGQPPMAGDLPPAVIDGQVVAGERDGDLAVNEADRDQAPAHLHGDHPVAVDAGRECDPGGERIVRQRQQMIGLAGEVLRDRPHPRPDPPLVLLRLELGQPGVEFIHAAYLRHRGEVVAAEIADLALDPALLMSAAKARLAVERGEPVVLMEGGPARVLLPRAAAEDHLLHSRGEVVVTDLTGRHPAQRGQCVDVSFEERLLTTRARDAMHGLARIGQPEGEQIAAGALPGQVHVDVPEVDLGVSTECVVPGHERLDRSPRLGCNLLASGRDEVPDRRIRDRLAELLLDPRNDPPHGVPLLARSLQISPQPGIDRLLVRLHPR